MSEEHRWIELSQGDEFAGYRIERKLGRGGMGILYLAVEPGLERHVALKLIAPEAAADEVFARRFAEESKIAASIEHPNVVPIYAAGEQEGVPFIAMRYVRGSDLGRRLAREGRLAPVDAVELIAQIGNGLDAIHAAGLIHRDVKPANVLLAGEAGIGHAYITDFGVARNVATDSGLTQTGRFVGTLDYVAPEQISGGDIDARVDVYALGCLLFKLLTGEVPFPRDGEAARLYAHLNDPPPAPSLHVPDVPRALDDVLARAMAKQREDRYPSAGDLGRAAVAALRGEQPQVPEHTVATGGAATQTAETIAAVAPPDDGDRGSAPGSMGKAAETRRLDTRPVGEDETRRRRRALALATALLAGLAVVVAVVALGGGDGGSSATTSSKAELISKADAICADSQNAYRTVRAEFPAGEASADVAYSKELVGISTPAVRRFQALDPPAGVRSAFEKYVQAQQRVHAYDVAALGAARRQDTAAYLQARRKRDEEQPERHTLARRIGLKTCSANPG